MVGMLSYLAAQRSQRQVIVVHADASEGECAQKSEMERLVEQLPNARLELYFRDQGERVDAPAIIPLVPLCICVAGCGSCSQFAIRLMPFPPTRHRPMCTLNCLAPMIG